MLIKKFTDYHKELLKEAKEKDGLRYKDTRKILSYPANKLRLILLVTRRVVVKVGPFMFKPIKWY